MPRRGSLAWIILPLLVAGCTSATRYDLPSASPADDVERQTVNQTAPGASGGAITNAAPVVRSLTTDRATGQNDGSFVATLTAEIFEPNAELQLGSVRVVVAGPSATDVTHALSPEEVRLTTQPVFGADQFAVWGGTFGDGVVHARFRLAFPAFTPAGTYTATLVAVDRGGLSATSAPVEIVLSKFSLVTVAPRPVDAAGAPIAGARWGGWTAAPGTSNVASTNYLKLVNDGDLDAPRLVVSFSDAAFVGVDDPAFEIPITGNVEFAWFEDKTPATTAPAEGTFAFTPGSGATVAFTGKGNVIYVAYRLVQLPQVLPAQAYQSAHTVTEL